LGISCERKEKKGVGAKLMGKKRIGGRGVPKNTQLGGRRKNDRESLGKRTISLRKPREKGLQEWKGKKSHSAQSRAPGGGGVGERGRTRTSKSKIQIRSIREEQGREGWKGENLQAFLIEGGSKKKT